VCACAEAHTGVDPTSTSLDKVPASVTADLTAGTPRDLLVELDEHTVDTSGSHAVADKPQGVALDVGDLPPALATPMMQAQVDQRALLYRQVQERVLDTVDSNQVELRLQYDNLPLLLVRVNTLQSLLELANMPEVLRIHEDRLFEHELAESLPLIHQPAAAAAGKTGAGTAVAVIDTGCDYSLPDFGSCSSPGTPGCKVAYAADFAGDDSSRDDNGHGTNVSAIVVGVAPSTQVLALDVFSGSSAPTSAILAAVDWSIQNRARYNIVAMNLSLGGGMFAGTCGADVFATALGNARTAGILTTVASGNSGWSSAMASPACAPAAISVGAVYDSNLGGLGYSFCTDATTAADKIACFSNSSQALSILAPGAMITAGGFRMTGTSQASPHVAGAIAVVRSAFPSESLNDSVARLTNNGPTIVDPRNQLARHRLDLLAAISAGSPTVVDRTGPTGSVLINANAAATNSASVTLTIAGSDASGVASMCISNSSACTTFQAFATTKTWSLPQGDGVKTVYVTLKDTAGNSSVFTDTIRIDATAPTGGVLSATPGNTQVLLNWTTAADSGSGVVAYKIVVAPVTAPTCAAGVAIYNGPASTFTQTGLQNGTVYAYRLCPVDAAGNIGTSNMVTARPVPEINPPVGSVTINGGASLTNSAGVMLTLTATDASGVGGMCISNTTTCTSWLPFAASKTWALGTSNGTVHVSVWFKDIYENITAVPVSATIIVDTLVPIAGSFTATAGVGRVSLVWTAASDANGIGSYKVVYQVGKTAPASCALGNVAYSGSATNAMQIGLAKGDYSYRACAIDRAGNSTTGIVRSVLVQ
jgi:subtilisin family serine protease